MVLHLMRRRPIRLPPGFGLWALFLVWLVVGWFMLSVNPVGTVQGTVPGRSMAYSLRLVSYLALTVMLVYVGNLTEKELPRRRVVGLMAWMFAVTVGGGWLGCWRRRSSSRRRWRPCCRARCGTTRTCSAWCTRP